MKLCEKNHIVFFWISVLSIGFSTNVALDGFSNTGLWFTCFMMYLTDGLIFKVP